MEIGEDNQLVEGSLSSEGMDEESNNILLSSKNDPEFKPSHEKEYVCRLTDDDPKVCDTNYTVHNTKIFEYQCT